MKVITLNGITYTFNSGRTYKAVLRIEDFNIIRATIELVQKSATFAGLYNIVTVLFAYTEDVQGDSVLETFWRENRHKSALDVWGAVLGLEDENGAIMAWFEAYSASRKQDESADFLADKPTPAA